MVSRGARTARTSTRVQTTKGASKTKTLWGAQVTGPALSAAARLRVATWDERARAPRKWQLDHLLSHCRKAANTAFGRRTALAGVQDYTSFRERVPLRTYADFEPELERKR